MTEPLAHSGNHLLADHLQAVANIAAGFSEYFETANAENRWAYMAGLWHDLGKYRPGFQEYINATDDPDSHIEGKVANRDKTHSAAGALWAIRSLEESHGQSGELAARVLAYIVAGHHAGLDNWNSGLAERLQSEDSLREFRDALIAEPPPSILSHGNFTPDLKKIPGGSAGFALWVRMLFSCLIDADFLDTEAHFDKDKPARRDGFPTIEQMLFYFDSFINTKSASAVKSTVNDVRLQVLEQCRSKALLPPGFFSITVPTGGGKTLSSMAFALNHAKVQGKRRVIYAIPYTSIIEQTAEVFRDVLKPLGDQVVIEHHSQADAADKDETARSRLACENWDAPLIVTTNVQLFESLFAAKTSRCRKLHNLINSVIVLDEAQQLPPSFLQPILDALNLLVKHYGVTVVFCTATQPALTSTKYFDESQNLMGVENVREIIDNPDELFNSLERVTVELPKDFKLPVTWADIAVQIAAENCVLAIVGTRKSARELHRLLPEGTLHLSALMCGAHRKAVIAQIKERLKKKREGIDLEPLRVVSTQLIEAGVDIDFPVVFRALAGLDSIAQAAGRCNREGLGSKLGKVVVFVPQDPPPLGHLRKGTDACISVLNGCKSDPLARSLFENYFRQFYGSVDLDKQRICSMLKVDQNLAVDFRRAADAFRLIEEQATVVVRYKKNKGEIEELLEILATEGISRKLMRRLQSYTISIPMGVAGRMLSEASLVLALPGLYLQINVDGLYDPVFGFKIGGDLFSPLDNVI